ncbi:hypothetical protein CPT_Mater116 [Bacillus phage Mater]|uniref:Uncharacterized protein n=1 Tax=Bacillus phage Mater TaxID=1540090 RepID=A0A0A0RUM7_9CAUD|nr:hypothetical protein CPT_Mater116 [Bacillus phage Mater]AIW03273.1 hypothetical protein CPT_Mater116 [Bacillus phage Mater]
MEKSNLQYTFERIASVSPRFQVRINGEFIMYTTHNDPELVDKDLSERGFMSREEVYRLCSE